MISNWGDGERNNVHRYTKFRFCVASHPELTILSGKFRITEHAQSIVDYFNFFQQNPLEVCKICIFTRLWV